MQGKLYPHYHVHGGDAGREVPKLDWYLTAQAATNAGYRGQRAGRWAAFKIAECYSCDQAGPVSEADYQWAVSQQKGKSRGVVIQRRICPTCQKRPVGVDKEGLLYQRCYVCNQRANVERVFEAAIAMGPPPELGDDLDMPAAVENPAPAPASVSDKWMTAEEVESLLF